MKKQNNITIGNSIQITFTKTQLKYINILIQQSKKNHLKDKPFLKIYKEILTLLESRKIYTQLYSYQYKDEKEVLFELLEIFKLIQKIS